MTERRISRARPGGKARKLSGIRLRPPSDDPFYNQVRSAIKIQIADGQLQPGQRLPPIRKICAELNLAYATVARGIRDLVKEGVLEAKTGRGTHVALRRTSRMQTIGLLGHGTFKKLLDVSRYYHKLIHLIQDELLDRGQTVAYSQWSAETPLAEMFNGLQQIDGLMLMSQSNTSESDVVRASRLGVPIIGLGGDYGAWGIPTVDSANCDDTERTVRYLQSLGHDRIAMLSIGGERIRPEHCRVTGYINAMQQGRVQHQPDWKIVAPLKKWAEALLAISPRPTAVMIDSASRFTYLCEHLAGLPLKPGKNLMIAAYDEDLWQQIGPTDIEHVRVDQPLESIARTAVEELLRMLEDKTYDPPQRLMPSTVIHVQPDGSESIIQQ